MDEINSFLGLIKIKSGNTNFSLKTSSLSPAEAVGHIQQDLFIIQAELAGAPKTITEEKVKRLEEIVDEIEKILPPIKTFFVSGGVELAALSDIARTIARRAERRIIRVVDEGKIKIGKDTLAYLNRLSSVLYAFARAFNHFGNVQEEAPKY